VKEEEAYIFQRKIYIKLTRREILNIDIIHMEMGRSIMN